MSEEEEEKQKRLNEVPPGLGELIDQVNILPSFIQLYPLRHSLPYLDDNQFEENHSDLYQRLEELTEQGKKISQENEGRRRKPELDNENIELRIESFKKDILGNLDLKANFSLQSNSPNFEKSQYKELLYASFFNYKNYLDLRMNLNSFAGLKNLILERNGKISVHREIYLSFDEKGRFKVQIDELLDALDGVEFKRIGKCRLCGRIFWIGNMKMVCCSHKCGNVLNNRKLREAYKDDPEGYKYRKLKKYL